MRKLCTLMVVAGLLWAAGRASAQEPIVAMNVKPTNVKFGPWSKPAVLKSADDAAKLYGKDALDALTKKVDFKKQIVLVFAWQGSGGDKLSYVVAESFPEQITFSRKPGLTRDLRQHVHVFALRSNVKWSVKGVVGKKRKGDAQPTNVRPIPFKPADPTVGFKIGGQNKVTTLDSADAVKRLLGADAAKQLTDAINFEKEQLILVSWSTSGPPEGRLMHETKDRKITFYIQGPRAQFRGQRLRIAADFFGVPRGVPVAFDAKER